MGVRDGTVYAAAARCMTKRAASPRRNLLLRAEHLHGDRVAREALLRREQPGHGHRQIEHERGARRGALPRIRDAIRDLTGE